MSWASPRGFIGLGPWDDAMTDLVDENADGQRRALEDMGQDDYRPYGSLQDVFDSFMPPPMYDQPAGPAYPDQGGVVGDTGAYAGFAAPNPDYQEPDIGLLTRFGRALSGQSPFDTGPSRPAPRGSLGGLALTPFDVQRAYDTANVDIPYYTPFIENTVRPAVAGAVNAPFQAAGLDTELPGELASGLVPSGFADVAMTLGPAAEAPLRRVAGHYTFPPEVPQTLYHWTPEANVGSIAESGLNEGSWLARTPEEAQNLARIPNRITGALGLPPVSRGQVFEVPGEGAVPTRTTLTREPAYRSTDVLPATPVEMPEPVPNALGRLVGNEGGYVRFNGNPEPTDEPLSVFQRRPEARVNAAGELEVQQPGGAFERQVPEASAPPSDIEDLKAQLRQAVSPEGVAAMKAEEENIARQEAVRAAQTMGGMQGGNTSALHRQLQASLDAFKRLATEEGGQSTVEAPFSAAKEILGTAGSLTSAKSMLSPPGFRQGFTRLTTNPRGWLREMQQSLKAGVSEETATELDKAMRADEWVRSTEGATLQANTPFNEMVRGMQGGKTMAGQEPHLGRTWEDVGGQVLDFGQAGVADTHPEELQNLRRSWLGRKIAESRGGQISDRQAAIEINLHRTNWYREVASRMEAAGLTAPEDVGEYVKLRRFIEHATQRGSWAQGDVPLFFSTRAISGRVQLIGDLLKEGIYNGILRGQALNPGASQEAAKLLVTTAGAGAAMVYIPASLGLGRVRLAGGLPVLDLGTGEHHRTFDPWAGWNSLAKLTLGIGEDAYKRIDRGEKTDEFGNVKRGQPSENIPQDIGETVFNRSKQFLRKSLGPAAGEVVNIGTGKDFAGRDYNLAKDVKSGNLFVDAVTPFIVSDIYEAYREGGVEGAAERAPASFFSLGGSDYTEEPKKSGKKAGFSWGGTSFPKAAGFSWGP